LPILSYVLSNLGYLNIAVFWGVTPCSLIGVYRRFTELAASIVIVDEFSETSVGFYQANRLSHLTRQWSL